MVRRSQELQGYLNNVVFSLREERDRDGCKLRYSPKGVFSHLELSRKLMENLKGINLAFAQLLAKESAHVIVADIQDTPAFRKFQRSTTSTKVLFQKTDISKWEDLENLFAFAKLELGAVDLLCNGAGVFEPVGAPRVDTSIN